MKKIYSKNLVKNSKKLKNQNLIPLKFKYLNAAKKLIDKLLRKLVRPPSKKSLKLLEQACAMNKRIKIFWTLRAKCLRSLAFGLY